MQKIYLMLSVLLVAGICASDNTTEKEVSQSKSDADFRVFIATRNQVPLSYLDGCEDVLAQRGLIIERQVASEGMVLVRAVAAAQQTSSSSSATTTSTGSSTASNS